jgi:1,4-dihydroxy-2-naphthoate octaprenyltransferase
VISPEERLKRGRSVRLHVIVALFALLACIAANAIFTSQYPWWLWVLMAWMPLIAAHTARSMGLFDRQRVDRNKEGR